MSELKCPKCEKNLEIVPGGHTVNRIYCRDCGYPIGVI